MANKKISQLNQATTLTNETLIPVVNNGITEKANLGQLIDFLPSGDTGTTASRFGIEDNVLTDSRSVELSGKSFSFINGEFAISGAVTTQFVDTVGDSSFVFYQDGSIIPAYTGKSLILVSPPREISSEPIVNVEAVIDGVQTTVQFELELYDGMFPIYVTDLLVGDVTILGYESVSFAYPKINMDVETVSYSAQTIAMFDGNSLKKGVYIPFTHIDSNQGQQLPEVGDPTKLYVKQATNNNGAGGGVFIYSNGSYYKVGSHTGLEGVGGGYRLIGVGASNYGTLGSVAVDLSYSFDPSDVMGATGNFSFATGVEAIASGEMSHAGGNLTVASGYTSYAQGSETVAGGDYSHVEGRYSKALGNVSHAEGSDTRASGFSAHAEGWLAEAGGDASHAEGFNTRALGLSSHAEGYNTIASGSFSHATGEGTIAKSANEIAGGKYNTDYTPTGTDNDKLISYGNGTSQFNRSDAFILQKNGIVKLPTVTPAMISSGDVKTVVTKEYLQQTPQTFGGGITIPFNALTLSGGSANGLLRTDGQGTSANTIVNNASLNSTTLNYNSIAVNDSFNLVANKLQSQINAKVVDTSITTAQTATNLNALYSGVPVFYTVYCTNMTPGAVYVKMTAGGQWMNTVDGQVLNP